MNCKKALLLTGLCLLLMACDVGKPLFPSREKGARIEPTISSDGKMVVDRNGNGTIDAGRELFGVDTLKRNGQLATDKPDGDTLDIALSNEGAMQLVFASNEGSNYFNGHGGNDKLTGGEGADRYILLSAEAANDKSWRAAA